MLGQTAGKRQDFWGLAAAKALEGHKQKRSKEQERRKRSFMLNKRVLTLLLSAAMIAGSVPAGIGGGAAKGIVKLEEAEAATSIEKDKTAYLKKLEWDDTGVAKSGLKFTWDQDAMKKLYGAAYLVIAEGMAMWSEIQYLYLINETRLSDRTFERDRKRNDEYGIGLNLYVEQYSMTRGIVLEGETPFRNRELPLDPSLIRK